MPALIQVCLFLLCGRAALWGQNQNAQQQTAQEGQEETDEEKEKQAQQAGRKAGDMILTFGGAVLIFNEDGGLHTAPLPVLPSGIVSFDWVLLKRGIVNLAVDAHLGFYGTNYIWIFDRPYPTEIENRLAFVFGFITGASAKLMLPLSIFLFNTELGFAFDLRIITEAADLNKEDSDDARAAAEKIREYYWNGGRFFYPSFGVGLDFPVVTGWNLGFSFKMWMPVVQMAYGESPGLNDWRFGFALTVSKHFNKKKKPTETEPEAEEQPQTPAADNQ
ncbi:MAG: hypothetical protein LBD20_03035 [Spirochaetaceae bacterium]|nr:hypothetical protein [Spirochaetaceae bacterium]